MENEMNGAKPYNPLDKRNLGFSVAEALLLRDPVAIKDLAIFEGAGVYAIYYIGLHPAYDPLIKRHSEQPFGRPIYVGKAVPAGARKGGFGLDSEPGKVLSKRLIEHRRSIEETENLDADDFSAAILWLTISGFRWVNRY